MDKFKNFWKKIGKEFVDFFLGLPNNFKTNMKSYEKFGLFIGASLFLISGLIWNIYSDTILHTTVWYLVFGLLTSIAGAVFLFVGGTVNSFDIKTNGLVFNGVGILLGSASIAVLVTYGAKETAGSGMNAVMIMLLVFIILGIISSIFGYVLQLYRKANNIEE